ncbi:PD-(D/E)XK nuclease family protein [Rhodomicrobium sp. Az07]|uniref:PDDEXK-like family protein n=1 Tax=Rhodomicrobium sp. Az07 TaxID=2839034 RepID=UPI001BE64B43|nr:PD-(D/E)XK nuclease family protein [Rhodomicrobium sp. Az07]
MSDRSFDHDIRYYFDTAAFLVKSAEAIDRELAEKTGKNFNIFDALELSYENHISRILRNLLDPKGSHGQGTRFLEAFLEQCKEQAPAIRGWAGDLSDVSVIPEFRTLAERRIDLVVKLPPDRYIGIENKPFASEGSEQLDAYAEHLEKESRSVREAMGGGTGINFYLIYLCGHAGLPSSLKRYAWLRDEHHFVDMRYNRRDDAPSLKSWANRCAQIAEADKLRIFMRDFSHWLAAKFNEFSEGDCANV